MLGILTTTDCVFIKMHLFAAVAGGMKGSKPRAQDPIKWCLAHCSCGNRHNEEGCDLFQCLYLCPLCLLSSVYLFFGGKDITNTL